MAFLVKSDNRIIGLDLLKGLVIVIVVWGHLMCYYVDIPKTENSLYLWTMTFAMPVFMALSGYFSYKSFQSNNLKKFITKRFYRLLVPCFSWTLILIVSDAVLQNGFNTLSMIHICKESLWFVKSLFICGILGFISLYPGENRILRICTICFISQFIVFWNVYSMFPCFLLGCLLKKKFKIVLNNWEIISITSSVIFIILSIYVSQNHELWSLGEGMREKVLASHFSINTFNIALDFYIKKGFITLIGMFASVFLITTFYVLFDKKNTIICEC